MMLKLISVLFLFISVNGNSDNVTQEKIIGGGIANEGEFPYVVSIQYRDSHLCGGAILDNYWILTAAHCLVDRLTDKFTVIAGTNHLDHDGDFYNVSKYISHAKFSKLLGTNDIGLIKVDKQITFNKKVQSIKLPEHDTLPGNVVTLSGWGRTGIDEAKSNDLKKIELKTISNIECFISLKPTFLWSTNICTRNKKGEGACRGDSGSPLVSNGEIKGIVSWAKGCATGKPDVFTRVYKYLDWIKENKHV